MGPREVKYHQSLFHILRPVIWPLALRLTKFVKHIIIDTGYTSDMYRELRLDPARILTQTSWQGHRPAP